MVPSTSAVILKFELMEAPITENSGPCHIVDVADESADRSNDVYLDNLFYVALGPVTLVGMNQIMLVKSLLVARDIYLKSCKDLVKPLAKVNNTKILEFLSDAWAKDRRAEWSIWMVYSKVEMPHHYISTGNHDSSHHVVDKRVSSFWKLADEPVQTAATRAELHRRSIAQMRGHHLDLQLLRNQWLLMEPKTEVLMSEVNEDKTGDFRDMGLRLAEEVQKTLDNFKNIILLSSPQNNDKANWKIRRIELCRAASLDYSKKGRVFLEMLNNCLDQIRAPTSQQRVFMRFDVNFDTSSYGRNFNTFIGRTAHIEFLESDIFARFIMGSFQELFR
ncbi:hypothetical protein GH714_009937 [Hevea brasiliensis]|uniref:Uncharacterized protein n=1 Tax=Hevea brasiliensis TaxID=3981 RepID=A0A6A6NGD5_HEVBR|nr:hypothetical protein GH714_009937 [Hevea brasiliensis]